MSDRLAGSQPQGAPMDLYSILILVLIVFLILAIVNRI